MPAEAISGHSFADAVDALDPGKRIEVEFAIYAIEDDPSWRPPDRHIAPADSPYHGFMADMSVDGYVIIYKSVDHGAAVELWYLYELPDSRGTRGPRGPVFVG